MNEINFSKNWNNKLDCDVFTTIRKWTRDKDEFYKNRIDAKFRIILDGEFIGLARLRDRKAFRLDSLPRMLLKLDVGVANKYEILKIFKELGIYEKDIVTVLLFERMKKK